MTKKKMVIQAADEAEAFVVLTREALLHAMAPKVEKVDVPELGGSVYIRQLGADERVELSEKSEKFKKDNPAKSGVYLSALFLTAFLADKTGARLFTEEEIPHLVKSRFEAMDVLVKRGLEINGMTTESVDELEGNSEPGPSDDSPSPLPES